ncbi:MAG TPA: adenosylcobalamin-dependent ribonucleoside-diphosphate reductase [Sneathiellales bacterium]|nr:adenosylcobalamin-dependent ribonucleoside-diphosphate reductase [Sneathiellales bacterium]
MVSVTPLSRQIWDMKYRLKAADGTPVDGTIEDTWNRVAKALAASEKAVVRDHWEAEFRGALDDFKFLPAGRILAGAGTSREVTLFNCFVMGQIPDDMSGIFEHLREAALTMQKGGGIGYDFSTLRPKGAPVKGVGADASGPLSFMDVWDAMCRTIMSAGSRRGAMMATMRCDHPDIQAFIEAKRDAGRLRMFNLSVLATDAFMVAVKENGPWDLVFDGAVHATLPAREIWDQIMRATFAYAEPGVIFIDRINRANNLHYAETITATNPCGEQPLPPYGACLLGSINLARLVKDPFTEHAAIDPQDLANLVRVSVRMLDNVVDISKFPLAAQAEEAKKKRRIGLGVTGLADALIMCRVRYGAANGLRLTETWMAAIERAAYLASVDLAREKGTFPLYDQDYFMSGERIGKLDSTVRHAIAKYGVRNALLTSIAPTGTISLFANNVSSGLEPVFSFSYTRKVLMPDGTHREERVSSYAHQLYCRLFGEDAPLPDYFVTSLTLSPNDHVAMQSVVQKYVDSSISKTINCPSEISFDDFKDIYLTAFNSGCKGCTTYRPNEITGSVLEAGDGSVVTEEKQETLPLDEPPARPEDVFDAGNVIAMTLPLDRPGVLEGNTYKVRWPESDHAIYITVNDVLQDGRLRPFEVFINSKNMEHYAWTVALTRMISAVFRRGGDISFVVEELKAVFDPRGGCWMNGKYVPSLLAAIGSVIEQHLIAIGFIAGSEQENVTEPKQMMSAGGVNRQEEGTDRRLQSCPRCGAPSLVRQEGCDTCLSCGHSKCS